MPTFPIWHCHMLLSPSFSGWSHQTTCATQETGIVVECNWWAGWLSGTILPSLVPLGHWQMQSAWVWSLPPASATRGVLVGSVTGMHTEYGSHWWVPQLLWSYGVHKCISLLSIWVQSPNMSYTGFPEADYVNCLGNSDKASQPSTKKKKKEKK